MLSYASSRFTWGQAVVCEPSRFIDEIDAGYLQFESRNRPSGGRSLMGGGFERPFTGGLNKPSGGSNQPLRSLKEVTQTNPTNKSGELDIKVGYNVEHDRFGKGKVTKMEGSGPDKKATIFFPHHGSKTVLLRFANLTILED